MNINAAGPASGFYSSKNILIVAVLSIIYLMLSYWLVGYKPEQLFLIFFFITFYFASRHTRKFIIAFSIFIVYWIVFDYMKAFPNYRYNEVHLAGLYNAEKKLFGLHFNGMIITPNEYWLRNGSTFLDIMSGVFYLTWVPVPLLFACYLFFAKRKEFFYFFIDFFFSKPDRVCYLLYISGSATLVYTATWFCV